MKNFTLIALVLMISLIGFGCNRGGGGGGEKAESVNGTELDQLSDDLNQMVDDVEQSQSDLNTLESQESSVENL
jgi:TolA-binding protein